MEHHHHGENEVHVTHAFIAGIALNFIYVVVQVIAGLKINSLSLLSDAGHNFMDVSGLALSMLAFRLTKSKSTKNYTYGYKKSSILISLLNTVILLVSIGAIGYEAFGRFQHPEQIPGKIVAEIAVIGIFINGLSAFLFFREKEKDLNIKSAFLHLFSDTLISIGLVLGGLLMYYTHLYWIDPLLSVVICLVIVWSTWNLLRSSLHLSLDGVPANVDIELIIRTVEGVEGVVSFHHLHVWAISTQENALTGHLVVSEKLSESQIHKIRQAVKRHLTQVKINHCTLEVESEKQQCMDEIC